MSGSEVTVKEGRKEGTSIEAFEVRKVVRRSSFVVRCSLFVVRWFVRWFVVRRSSFVVGSFVLSFVGSLVRWFVRSFARCWKVSNV